MRLHSRLPIVLAPLAGGPSTPELAAAVSEAGGFGFLGGGYLTAAALAERIAATRRLTAQPFGVNLFVPGDRGADADVQRYAARLAAEARAAGVDLGDPRFDDDDWAAKLQLFVRDPVPVVSFTFGAPSRAVIGDLHGVGTEVWVTVTAVDEARAAVAAGADVLVVQGSEAGGHRATFVDRPDDGVGLLVLLQLVRAAVPTPLVAAGGLMTGAAIAAVLAAGAQAAALGTAFLECPEAGTSDVHRAALRRGGTTATTRAFTGRTARGIRNRFLIEHSAEAPSAYPQVHHLTAPLRAAARAAGDPELVNLWAGQGLSLIRSMPAQALVAKLSRELHAAGAEDA